jgi:hypothetical protein
MAEYQIQPSPTRTGDRLHSDVPGYSEELWTPSVDDPAGGSATYTFQRGILTKIGRIVFFHGFLAIDQINTGSTTVIFGLNYPVGGNTPTTAQSRVVTARVLANSATNIVSSHGVMVWGGTWITIASRTVSSAADSMLNPIFQNGTQVQVSGFYEIDR